MSQGCRPGPGATVAPPPAAPTQILADVFPILSGSPTSGTTATIPAGALFFANIIATGGNDSFTSFTDSGGVNTYNFIQTTDASNPAIALVWGVLTQSLPSGSTFTAVTSDTSQWGIGQAYYTTGAAGGLIGSATHNDDTTNGTTSLSMSVSVPASGIVIGAFNTSGNAVTWTEDGNFTTLHNDTFNITSYNVIPNGSWHPSFSATGPFNAVLAAFKAG